MAPCESRNYIVRIPSVDWDLHRRIKLPGEIVQVQVPGNKKKEENQFQLIERRVSSVQDVDRRGSSRRESTYATAGGPGRPVKKK